MKPFEYFVAFLAGVGLLMAVYFAWSDRRGKVKHG